MKQTVIGLSGHIDHGKTALVKALTGINTDYLSEEQQRGMTIDIGFAFLTDSITLIDVPGHEKFVKNMMVGVSNIDVALLVVAADDGIMPQTREHCDILSLLDIRAAVIAINKTDLTDEDWIEMVELDLVDMCDGTVMENAPIIRVSAETGDGIEKLRSTLIKICEGVPNKKDRGIFRQHVDRVFSMKGYGTVVTGTVNSGYLQIGDSVEIIPGGLKARVRGLQSHNTKVDVVNLGDRAAINLQGVEKNDITRGSQLATPGFFQSVRQMGVVLRLLRSVTKPLGQNKRIRIHMGTQEVMARIAFVQNKTLEPGDEGPALLRLESPLVAARGDKFIVRSYSPVLTIGGGKVLEISIQDKWKIIKHKLKTLYENPESKQLFKLVEQETNLMTLQELHMRLGISEYQIKKWVEAEKYLFWLNHNNGTWLLSHQKWNLLKEKVQSYIQDFHTQKPFQTGVQKEEIRQQLECDGNILDALLLSMLEDGSIKKEGKAWFDPSFTITLNEEDLNIQINVLNMLDKEGFTSSSLDQLSSKMGYEKNKLLRILNVAELEGKLLRIDGNLMFTKQNFIKLKNKVIKHFASSEILLIPEFKALAQTSRKYAVPLLEYFDKQKITYREENGRKLV